MSILAGGIEGLLFSLLPLTFMDGRKVWDWSRAAWLVVALPVTFVFIAALFNRSDSFLGAIEDSSIKALFVACFIFLSLALPVVSSSSAASAFARHTEPEAAKG